MRKKILFPLLIIVSLAVGFTGGFYYNSKANDPSGTNLVNKDVGQPKGVDFSNFWTAWNTLQAKYVDKSKLDTQAMVYGAIDGMVKAIGDPYTVFFQPKASQDFAEQINGSFGGVGIEIGLRNNVLTVITPIKGSPAARAGILAGDKIIKIGDKSTEGMSVEEAVGLIRGAKGTVVKLTYARDKVDKPIEVAIKRDIIKIPAVDWKIVNGDTAYVNMYVFNKNVDSEFKNAADQITRSNAKKIILDLRNNPGGLLDSAVNIASYFMDPEKVVTVERFGDGTEDQYRTAPNGKLKNYPLIVLINKGSASASEILAGALKDNRGVTILGETSYGKGSVQEVDDFPDKSSLKITIAKWYTPNGISINEHGIKPDIEVKITEDDVKNNKDPQLEKAEELIRNL